MMKKVFYVIITASILLCACHLDHRMPDYDNLVKKEDAITRQYPREMVDELTHKIEEEGRKWAMGSSEECSAWNASGKPIRGIMLFCS